MGTRITLLAAVAALAGGATHAQLTCSSPGVDMRAWWDGDSLSGADALDLVGDEDGLLLGNATTGPGRVGDAFYLDGSGDCVTRGEPLLDTSGPWTVEGWIYPNSTSFGQTQGIVAEVGGQDPNNTGHFAFRVLTSGVLQIFRGTGSGFSVTVHATTAPILFDNWSHVAARWDGANLRIFVNGIQPGQVTGASMYNQSEPHEFVVGAVHTGTSNQFFDGRIDELSAYSRALSDAEIQAIALAGSLGKCKDCQPLPADALAYWTMDDVCPTGPTAFTQDRLGSSSLRWINVNQISGVRDQAMEFDGSGDWLYAGQRVLDTDGPFTVEAWIRTDQANDGIRTIVSESGTIGIPGQFALRVLTTDAVQMFRTTGGGNAVQIAQTSAAVPVGTWTHVVGLWDGIEMRIYLNGELESTMLANNLWNGDTGLVTRIGSMEDGSQSFDGRIDEVVLYRRALSDSEVEDAYRAGILGKCLAGVPDAPCELGSGEDFELRTTVGPLGTEGNVHATQKLARAGDLLSVTMDSPGGFFVGFPPILLAQAFPNGAYPANDLFFTSLGLDLGQVVFAFNGLVPGAFGGATVLGPGGLSLAFPVPAGLEGSTVRFQGVAWAPGVAADGFLAVSEAHDFRID